MCFLRGISSFLFWKSLIQTQRTSNLWCCHIKFDELGYPLCTHSKKLQHADDTCSSLKEAFPDASVYFTLVFINPLCPVCSVYLFVLILNKTFDLCQHHLGDSTVKWSPRKGWHWGRGQFEVAPYGHFPPFFFKKKKKKTVQPPHILPTTNIWVLRPELRTAVNCLKGIGWSTLCFHLSLPLLYTQGYIPVQTLYICVCRYIDRQQYKFLSILLWISVCLFFNHENNQLFFETNWKLYPQLPR